MSEFRIIKQIKIFMFYLFTYLFIFIYKLFLSHLEYVHSQYDKITQIYKNNT